MTLTVASFNVNSIKARLPNVLAWLRETKPDVVCIQEIKTIDEGFPRMEIEDLGYNIEVHGQKAYHGVAILSKYPIEEVQARLPGDETDEQARYLEVVISAEKGPVRIASIYLPNGNPAPGPKFDYKIAWMKRLCVHAEGLLKFEEPLILAGDYNVIQSDNDVWDPAAWEGDALTRPESREAFKALKWLGFTEAFEQVDGRSHQYTFYDYQAGAWPKGHGIRIDHLLLSPEAAPMLKSADIDKFTRDWEKPSDHVPVWIDLDI